MVDAGFAVGRGGTFVEYPFLVPNTQLKALLKNGALFPPGKDPLLKGGEALSRVYWSIPAGHALLLLTPTNKYAPPRATPAGSMAEASAAPRLPDACPTAF